MAPRSRPFAIARVEGTGDGFDLKAADSTRKPLHVLTLTYNPAQGTSRGDLVKTFRIVTESELRRLTRGR